MARNYVQRTVGALKNTYNKALYSNGKGWNRVMQTVTRIALDVSICDWI